MTKPSFLDAFVANIATHSLLFKGSRIVVGVSGGADSVALLLALYEIRSVWGLDIIIVHVDHGLRASSKKDAIFVQNLADTLHLPVVIKINTTKKPSRKSVEEFARDIRYAFLCQVAKQKKAVAIVVAHHQDDLAETVLMRLMRGSGLKGLAAMRPVSIRQGFKIVRPFLCFSRLDIISFLKKKKAEFVTDPTNRLLDFERNKIRLKLIPFLKKDFSAEICSHLSNLSELAADDIDYLENQASQAFTKVCLVSSKMISFDRTRYAKQPIALRRLILRRAILTLVNGPIPLGYKEMQILDRAIIFDQRGQIDFPQNLAYKYLKPGASIILKNI